MTTYALNPSRFTNSADLQKAVGQLYHLGLSNGVEFYGYLLEPDNTRSGGFHQRTDTAGRDALVQTASPNLIDRLLAFYPRVTDGDFSGGGYQEVWIDPKRYFDSDLDPRIPGFLQLRAQWARSSKAGLTPGTSFQVVAFNGDLFFSFGESNGNVYSANGGATGTAAGGAVVALDTDGSLLYAGTATHLWSSPDGSTWTQVDAALLGTAIQWWVVNQGTNGYFAYYQTAPNTLYKMDLSIASPIPTTNQIQVPVGSNAFQVVDLCEYQTSVAILTTDVRGPGSDVWYFDGQNLTRVIRIEGYAAQGICQALGSLYVGASAVGQTTSPILAKVDNGDFQVVAKPGSPFPTAGQSCLGPRASSQYVYWPVTGPSINGIAVGKGVILQYDVLTGAVTHLPNFGSDDYTTTGGSLRTLALLGDNVGCCFMNGSTGVLQYQTSAFGTLYFMASGWLVSSHIDFETPGIVKRFRRIEVHHAPLNAGESITVNAYVDLDPIAFTTALTPSATSSANTTAGSTLTALTFSSDTLGKTLYFAINVQETESPPSTTPRISYASIEVGGTWAWQLTLGCTSKRRDLAGNEETQPSGKDLAYLLLLAYEQGSNLTLYHRNGSQYTVAIESLEFWNPSPQIASGPQEMKDEEYFVQATLRQVA